MAEVTNLHRQHRPPSAGSLISSTVAPPPEDDPPPHEEDFYHQISSFAFEFDPFSPPNDPSNPSFFDDYAEPLDLGFDMNAELDNPGCEYEDPNCFFFGGEEDEEQMNFVTDLFEPRRQSLAAEDLNWDIDAGRAEESDDELGFGPFVGLGMGLRVAGIDSESDSEVNLGLVDNEEDAYDAFSVFNNNYLAGENEREESEWEEVSERIHFDERDNLNLVINGIEEISVASDISSSDREYSSVGDIDEGTGEQRRNLEWEVLLPVNNLEGTLEFEYSDIVANVRNEVLSRVNLPEDYIFTMEYDAVFGQLAENESAVKGSPPAAKSFVENLPSVVLTKEEIGENDNNGVACAVCKDEFVADEKGTKLPCCHLYHGDCIVPWLKIRNTCPVCRYELPTDDADYERRRRSERVGDGDSAGLLMILR
ncbi:RING/U-box superfamily protein [Striga asiatica]|uniref:RING-type E3 ubiquitin transferase n=1 Tax=Striga asiatica TaxID=4170 RepID=A0A5A7QN12_STRAF|nr:RING/U-box superfamily protein [Striga asiatica]